MIDVTALWSPAADEGAVRAAAGAWRSLAVRVECATPDLAAAAALVADANEGRAIDAFVGYWDGLAGPGLAHLDALAQACRAVAALLEAYADELARVRAELVELAVEIAATTAVGAAVTWATAGVGAAAAGATVAGLTLQAAALGAGLATRASAIARLVGIHAGIGALQGMATYAVVEPVMAARFRGVDDPLRSLTAEGFAWAALTGGAMSGWTAPAIDDALRAQAPLPAWWDLARAGRTIQGLAVDVTLSVPVALAEDRYRSRGAPGARPEPIEPVRAPAGR